jgi:hypothetical protein
MRVDCGARLCGARPCGARLGAHGLGFQGSVWFLVWFWWWSDSVPCRLPCACLLPVCASQCRSSDCPSSQLCLLEGCLRPCRAQRGVLQQAADMQRIAVFPINCSSTLLTLFSLVPHVAACSGACCSRRPKCRPRPGCWRPPRSSASNPFFINVLFSLLHHCVPSPLFFDAPHIFLRCPSRCCEQLDVLQQAAEVQAQTVFIRAGALGWTLPLHRPTCVLLLRLLFLLLFLQTALLVNAFSVHAVRSGTCCCRRPRCRPRPGCWRPPKSSSRARRPRSCACTSRCRSSRPRWVVGWWLGHGNWWLRLVVG